MASVLAVVCGDLEPPDNGRVEFNAVTVGSVATYSCFPGYVFKKGSVTRRICQPNGEWSGIEPICIRKYGKFNGPSFSITKYD